MKLNENYINPFTNISDSDFNNTIDNRKMYLDSNITYKDYSKIEKGIIGEIRYLTALEYMELAASQKDISVKEILEPVDESKIDNYSVKMKNGIKFPLPSIELGTYNQEGRHRMLAAANAFGKDTKFPVLIINKYSPTDEEIKEYVINKYGNENIESYIKIIKDKLKKTL